MSERDYLTLIEVLTLHQVLIERYGGSPGIRDMGALQAALYRPQSGYYDDVIQEAAALWESLSQNHPFVDGNKRVAFAVMDTFLRLNHVNLTANSEETAAFIYQCFAEKAFEYHRLESWLRQHVQPSAGSCKHPKTNPS